MHCGPICSGISLQLLITAKIWEQFLVYANFRIDYNIIVALMHEFTGPFIVHTWVYTVVYLHLKLIGLKNGNQSETLLGSVWRYVINWNDTSYKPTQRILPSSHGLLSLVVHQIISSGSSNVSFGPCSTTTKPHRPTLEIVMSVDWSNSVSYLCLFTMQPARFFTPH